MKRGKGRKTMGGKRVKPKPPTHAVAVHAEQEGEQCIHHVVGFGNIRVVIVPDEGVV